MTTVTTTTSNLSSRLKTLKSKLAELKMDSQTKSIALGDTVELKAEEILKVKKGDKVIDFTLLNSDGSLKSLSDYLKKGKVILVFYRGQWCPYCNIQLKHYQQYLTEINQQGASLVAISPQSPDKSSDMKKVNELGFDVLTDIGGRIAKRFTTVFRNSDEAVMALRKFGVDFESYYSDDSRNLPVPALLVINTDYTVELAFSEGVDFTDRVEMEEVLPVL